MEAGWRCCRGAVLPHTASTPPRPRTLDMVSISSGLRSPASLRWSPPALHLALGHHLASRLVTSVTMHSLMTPSCQPRTRQPISGQCVAAGPIGWRVYEAAWRINTSVERGEALVAVPASTAAHWSCDDSYWDRERQMGYMYYSKRAILKR